MEKFLVKNPPLQQKQTGRTDLSSAFAGKSSNQHQNNIPNLSRVHQEQPALPEGTWNLSAKQHEVLQSIFERRSVFFTGAAGTGKSLVLKVMMDALKTLNQEHVVAFTAPTGVAACNIGGLTIHSWAGIGIGKGSREDIVSKVESSKEAKKRWKNTEILVIDEISMLNGELFDVLSFVGKRLRADDRPFGGIQLIICGDFYQLPPVGLNNNGKSANGANGVSFCFESKTWSELFGDGQYGKVIVLDKIFRQRDPLFLSILNEIRRGSPSDQTNQVLKAKVHETVMEPTNSNTTLVHTKLFSLNEDVEVYNLQQLQVLKEGPVHVYSAVDEAKSETHLKQLKQGLKAPEKLELKVGAQVMLLKNLSTERGLVNGTRGVVTDFRACDDVRRNFDSVNSGSFKAAYYPVVEFTTMVNGRKDVVLEDITENKWDLTVHEREMASRVQLPLMLAWGISIHKSQGMTIPFLEVSFRGLFEYGQAYVALSRATDLEGLVLKSYDRTRIKANDSVKEFYRNLGYEQDSEHDASSTVQITIEDLAKLWKDFDDNVHYPKRDSNAWISSHKPIISYGSHPTTAKSPGFSDNMKSRSNLAQPKLIQKAANTITTNRSNSWQPLNAKSTSIPTKDNRQTNFELAGKRASRDVDEAEENDTDKFNSKQFPTAHSLLQNNTRKKDKLVSLHLNSQNGPSKRAKLTNSVSDNPFANFALDEPPEIRNGLGIIDLESDSEFDVPLTQGVSNKPIVSSDDDSEEGIDFIGMKSITKANSPLRKKHTEANTSVVPDIILGNSTVNNNHTASKFFRASEMVSPRDLPNGNITRHKSEGSKWLQSKSNDMFLYSTNLQKNVNYRDNPLDRSSPISNIEKPALISKRNPFKIPSKALDQSPDQSCIAVEDDLPFSPSSDSTRRVNKINEEFGHMQSHHQHNRANTHSSPIRTNDINIAPSSKQLYRAATIPHAPANSLPSPKKPLNIFSKHNDSVFGDYTLSPGQGFTIDQWDEESNYQDDSLQRGPNWSNKTSTYQHSKDHLPSRAEADPQTAQPQLTDEIRRKIEMNREDARKRLAENKKRRDNYVNRTLENLGL